MDIVLINLSEKDLLRNDMIVGRNRIDLWAILWWEEKISSQCWWRLIVDSFEDRPLADEIPEKIRNKMNIPGFKFWTPLELTYDTDEFMHGGDMLPGMIEGINNFLAIRTTSLKEIRQIVFKECIFSDVVYSILPVQDVSLQKKANMYASFFDKEGKEYFLYAQDIAKTDLNRERQPICLQNKLAIKLLLEKQTMSHKVALWKSILSMWSHMEYLLLEPNISIDERDHYKQKMSENKWFMIETVWDMVEIFCSASFEHGWLAARYENIKRAKNIDLECFFDGTLRLVINQTTTPRIVGNHWRYQYDFSLLHKDKETIVSWTATFRITESD